MDSHLTVDDFKNKAEIVVANVDNSGLLCGDEFDEADINVCLLIPDACVAPLIGKAGANINTTKALTGARVSFQKKENAQRGCRKCFHQGPLSSVMRAVAVALAFVQESTGGACTASVVVKHEAAGSVIGKGGQALKNVREETECKVSMEKAQEALPVNGGRLLNLEHESLDQLCKAIYLCVRAKGFASPTSREDQAQPDFGYGPMSSNKGGARFSPYGAGGGGGGGRDNNTCCVHGKRRGQQNLRPSPTMHGQFQCLDEDPCKGSANPAAAQAAAGYGQGYMGMPPAMGMGGMGDFGAMGGMQGMGGMGGGMDMGMYGASPYGGMGMGGGMGGGNNTCAIHGKKRGASNLQPHPTQPGLMVCMDGDACKGAGSIGGMGQPAQDANNTCATHGKRRGARNLQPHPSQAGLFVCQDEDQCK